MICNKKASEWRTWELTGDAPVGRCRRGTLAATSSCNNMNSCFWVYQYGDVRGQVTALGRFMSFAVLFVSRRVVAEMRIFSGQQRAERRCPGTILGARL